MLTMCVFGIVDSTRKKVIKKKNIFVILKIYSTTNDMK